MKELSIEQKARRYDEAIERANNLHKDAVEMENNMTTKTCEIIFPELKKSEDKRIVKELLTFFRESTHGWHILTNKEYDSWTAWLEKQGEQKPFDYENSDIQQKDFAPKETVKEAESNLTPLERKVKDILFSFHINAADGISFDGTMAIVHNLITLCQQEQKPAWSEEDDYMLESIVSDFAAPHKSSIGQDKWLKSLKQRYAWKPSDEQMEQLKKYCPDNRPLTSLYEQLKKLKA